MCLSIVTLTGVAGMAVDLGNWYFNADKVQRSADAAALAGAPSLPNNPTAAFAAARQTLIENGFIDSHIYDANTTATDPVTPNAADPYTRSAYIYVDPTNPNHLKIDAGVKVHTILVGLIGVKDEWLGRHATSDWRNAVPMGSPANVLGSEPIQPFNSANPNIQQESAQDQGTAFNNAYWLNIGGGQTNKSNGDRYASGLCLNSHTNGCSGSVNAEENIVDGKPSHQYIVRIPPSMAGVPVTLQAFDAAYVDVGDHCDGGVFGGDLGNAKLTAQAKSSGNDPALYAKGAISPYCTGDYLQGGNGTDPTLHFKIQNADKSDNATGSALGTKDFLGANYPGSSSDSATMKDNWLADELASNNPTGKSLAASFRQWANVYTFSSPGDYIVTIETPVSSTGANRFALRLGAGNGNDAWTQGYSPKLSIFAKTALTVYTNATANKTSFYFARIDSSQAGRTLTLDLFDIGDASGADAVNLKILAPQGASGIPDGFLNCQQIGPDDIAAQGPQLVQGADQCGIIGATPAQYDGRIVKVKFTVPSTYQCVSTGGTSCWMALQFNVTSTSGGTTISSSNPSSDTTTWQIDDCGNPVKLLSQNATVPDDGDCPAAG